VAPAVCISGGTGALGFGLGLRWARAGVPVILGSRDGARAQDAAERARAAVPDGSFAGAVNGEGARDAGMVVLCVPFAAQTQTLREVHDSMGDGQVLIDATVPLARAAGGRATRTLGVWQGSAAQQAAELAPAGVTVCSALHTVSAPVLADLDAALDEDVLVCGDDRDAKAAVIELVGRIDGLRGVDCGRLELSRITEGLTALLISVNSRYSTHAGIRLTRL
jgi:NADPH-dependent F420 reductase